MVQWDAFHKLRADRDTLAAKLAEAVEALRPFADVVARVSQNHLNIEDEDWLLVAGKDLIRAGAFLARMEEKG